MNTNKIREALTLLAITSEHSERTAIAGKALLELDKAPKVLTVEDAINCMKMWVQEVAGCKDESEWNDKEWQKQVDNLRARLTAAIEAKR